MRISVRAVNHSCKRADETGLMETGDRPLVRNSFPLVCIVRQCERIKVSFRVNGYTPITVLKMFLRLLYYTKFPILLVNIGLFPTKKLATETKSS